MGFQSSGTLNLSGNLHVNSFFETRGGTTLYSRRCLWSGHFASAGLDYRVVGGLATFLYVEEREPDAGRLTKDIDIVVRRAKISRRFLEESE